MGHWNICSLSAVNYAVLFSNGAPLMIGESSSAMLSRFIQLKKLCFEEIDHCSVYANMGVIIQIHYTNSQDMIQYGNEFYTNLKEFRIHSRGKIDPSNWENIYITHYGTLYLFLSLFRKLKRKPTQFLLDYKQYMDFVNPIIEKWKKLSGLHPSSNVYIDAQKFITTFTALAIRYPKTQLRTRIKTLLRKLHNVENKYIFSAKHLTRFMHDEMVKHPEVSDKFKQILREQFIMEYLK